MNYNEDRLPINTSEKVKAVVEVILAEINRLPVELPATMNNPKKISSHLLSYLAYQLGADTWYNSWSDQEKRHFLMNLFIVHAEKGTVDSVERAISSFFNDIELIEKENFEFNYKANLSDDVNAVFNNEKTSQINAIVEKVKPVRSLLGSVEISLPKADLPIYFQVAMVFKPKLEEAA